jgi:hypothetical protein
LAFSPSDLERLWAHLWTLYSVPLKNPGEWL